MSQVVKGAKPTFMSVKEFTTKFSFVTFEVTTSPKSGVVCIIADRDLPTQKWFWVSDALASDKSLLKGPLCMLIPWKKTTDKFGEEVETDKPDYANSRLIVGSDKEHVELPIHASLI